LSRQSGGQFRVAPAERAILLSTDRATSPPVALSGTMYPHRGEAISFPGRLRRLRRGPRLRSEHLARSNRPGQSGTKKRPRPSAHSHVHGRSDLQPQGQSDYHGQAEGTYTNLTLATLRVPAPGAGTRRARTPTTLSRSDPPTDSRPDPPRSASAPSIRRLVILQI